MATRFVELNEAAKMLGLTPDQLVEMRSNGSDPRVPRRCQLEVQD